MEYENDKFRRKTAKNSRKENGRNSMVIQKKGMNGVMTDRRYLPEGTLYGGEENNYHTADLRRLERAMEQGQIIEGMAVRCDCSNMCLTVDLGCIQGIIPKEEALFLRDGEDGKDIAIITRVGKPVSVKITDIDFSGDVPRAILSRRAAQEECFETSVSALSPGDIIPATVTHLEPFGAFVDIGCGIVSLLTVDSISVSRISHPKDRFRCGEKIFCAVKSIDNESGRIYMTHRELLGTWEENASEFSVGETVAGVVRSIEEYGIFVELAPNLAGLAEYREGVNVGDRCAVFIKNIIPDRMKIKLVLIDSAPQEQSEIEKNKRIRKYYIDPEKVEHIDKWLYSPLECPKIIETIF